MENILRSDLPGEFVVVISNNSQAEGLEKAKKMGIKTMVINEQNSASGPNFYDRLKGTLLEHNLDLILLAGFMKILPPDLVSCFENKILNIHPSLLPAFPGLKTHKRALERGVGIHGCTVHFVTPELDAGPIIIQATVPVNKTDTEKSLAAKVLTQEHVIYAKAVRWFLEDKLYVSDGIVNLRSSELKSPISI